MAHADKIKDADAFFEVDPITRHIINRTPTKIILMQNDHNSERFTFSLPRFVEGHDMLESARAKLHYMNLSHPEVNGMYQMNDLEVDLEDAEKVKCSWLISGNVTKEAGAISFLIEFECYEGDTLVYSWHTQPHKGISIGETFDKEEEIAIRYADVLAQWEQRLFVANDDGVKNIAEAEAEAIVNVNETKDSAIAEIMAKGEETKATIPEDYATIDENLKHISKNVSNALKGSATGHPLILDDVSPFEQEITVTEDVGAVTITRLGKNLIGGDSFKIISGGVTAEYDKETQIFTLNGTTTTKNVTLSFGTYFTAKPRLKVGASYTLSLEYIGGECSNTSGNNVFYIGDSDTPDGTLNNWTNVGFAMSGKKTRTAPAYRSYLRRAWIYLGADAGLTFTNYQFKVQLEYGDTATEFTPFVEPVEYIGNHLDGIKISSLYPTTVLYSDDADVTIGAEYNRDINKAFAELQNALLSLGGNV